MRHLSSYFQALMFAVVFLLFISGSIGWALIYTLAGTGIASVVLLFCSRKNFRVSAECVSGITERGGTAQIRVTVQKTGFCFLPNIDITLSLLGGETVQVHTALTLRDSVSVTVPVKASFSGLNRCAVTGIALQDFMNIILLNERNSGVCAEYSVLPAYTDYIGPEVHPKVLPSEEEEAEEGTVVPSGGLPGCEHREYVPGDALRRINYKLSAKRGKLMVRLDESAGTAPVVIALADCCFPEAGETLMALSRTLLMRGGSVKVIQGGDSFSANSPQTLSRLREWIAGRPLAFSEWHSGAEIPPDADVIFDENGVRAAAN